jgi:hypothetical protein
MMQVKQPPRHEAEQYTWKQVLGVRRLKDQDTQLLPTTTSSAHQIKR